VIPGAQAMSALGHQLPRRGQSGVSALPPKAAAAVSRRRVRCGPKGDFRPIRSPHPLSQALFDELWLHLEQADEALEQLQRRRRAAADVEVDRHHGIYAAYDGIAAGKDAAVDRAIAAGDYPFGIRRRPVGPLKRLAHVARDRASDQEHVGMPRRSDEAQPETFKIVERVVEGVDFQFAAVA